MNYQNRIGITKEQFKKFSIIQKNTNLLGVHNPANFNTAWEYIESSLGSKRKLFSCSLQSH